MPNLTAQQIIEKFSLIPHPEGGFYKENYRSSEVFGADGLPNRYWGDRNFSTHIYFLLEVGYFSAFHKILSDECHHFYYGDPMLMHVIHENGQLETIRLGTDIENGDQFHYVVKSGLWFASEVAPGGNLSLIGCTVAPGFDFGDFELANQAALLQQYPQHSAYIERLCR